MMKSIQHSDSGNTDSENHLVGHSVARALSKELRPDLLGAKKNIMQSYHNYKPNPNNSVCTFTIERMNVSGTNISAGSDRDSKSYQ